MLEQADKLARHKSIVPGPISSKTSAAIGLIVSRVTSVLVAMASVSVLIGWLFRIPGLTSLYLPGPTLKTNSALCLTSAAVANLLLLSGDRRRRTGRFLAALPAVLGALTLSEHLMGWNLGIDQLLATEPSGALATVSPNRMGPPSSVANLLLGAALLLSASRSVRRRPLAHLFAFLACVIAVLPLIGYAFGLRELYAVARYTGISLVNALALFAMGVAIQAGRPDHGIASLVDRHDEVGVFARRLLPAAILLPFGLGWFLARALGDGLIDAPFAISAMALVLIVLLVAVIWSTGRQLATSLDARATTERALTESERALREADRQKTEFLATLSHELRNPLAPIRFAVELLNGAPSSAARARKTIERQVQHLTRLIDDLLDLTRITRDKLDIDPRPNDLRQLVADAVEAVAGELRDARHTLDLDLPPESIWLQVDRERVVQILVNLLTNAIRYSDEEGRIHVGASVGERDVTLYVRDTGHGIAAADLERVFERFVQVGPARHGGLGIGLALVKALVELHGGRVEARSEGLGRGAEFRVTLPRSTVPCGDMVPFDRPPIASRRILVVDDNRDAADMLGGLLEASGHHVKIAYGGEEALKQARSFDPEVGLLDIGMADMNGYQLASRLRHEQQPGVLFLVAITGWGQDTDRERATSAGFDAHLTKPADPAQIAALLATRFPRA